MNFRYFFKYDSLGRLEAEAQYHFDDDNIACTIKDSLDFTLVKYIYNVEGQKAIEKKFFPTYDSLTGQATGHKLGYVYHYDSGLEEVIK
jgi:hypothetical protein